MVFWLIMKFLNDQRITREDGNVTLTIKPVTTSQQARLLELGSLAGTGARIELTRYCLKNCIEKISIGGSSLDAQQVADGADLSDQDTLLVMIKIGGMVCAAAFPDGEETKK